MQTHHLKQVQKDQIQYFLQLHPLVVDQETLLQMLMEDQDRVVDTKVPEDQETHLLQLHLKGTMEDQTAQDLLMVVNSLEEAEAELVAQDLHLLHPQVVEAVELSMHLEIQAGLEALVVVEKLVVLMDLMLLQEQTDLAAEAAVAETHLARLLLKQDNQEDLGL